MGLDKDTQNKLFSAGYLAKGTVYALIGGFAFASVIGIASGGTNGPREVIRWIGTNSFGSILLFIIGLGLLAYCSWRFVRAFQDTSNEGSDKEGIAKRIGYASSGVVYGALATHAFKLALQGSSSGGGRKQDIISQILDMSGGQFIIGLLGAIMLGVAGFKAYEAITGKFMNKFAGGPNRADFRETYEKTGKAGILARAVIFAIIAYFLFRAAFTSDPSQFRGIEGSLEYLGQQSYGGILLGVIGAGLVFYGIFCFLRARYERP